MWAPPQPTVRVRGESSRRRPKRQVRSAAAAAGEEGCGTAIERTENEREERGGNERTSGGGVGGNHRGGQTLLRPRAAALPSVRPSVRAPRGLRPGPLSPLLAAPASVRSHLGVGPLAPPLPRLPILLETLERDGDLRRGISIPRYFWNRKARISCMHHAGLSFSEVDWEDKFHFLLEIPFTVREFGRPERLLSNSYHFVRTTTTATEEREGERERERERERKRGIARARSGAPARTLVGGPIRHPLPPSVHQSAVGRKRSIPLAAAALCCSFLVVAVEVAVVMIVRSLARVDSADLNSTDSHFLLCLL